MSKYKNCYSLAAGEYIERFGKKINIINIKTHEEALETVENTIDALNKEKTFKFDKDSDGFVRKLVNLDEVKRNLENEMDYNIKYIQTQTPDFCKYLDKVYKDVFNFNTLMSFPSEELTQYKHYALTNMQNFNDFVIGIYKKEFSEILENKIKKETELAEKKVELEAKKITKVENSKFMTLYNILIKNLDASNLNDSKISICINECKKYLRKTKKKQDGFLKGRANFIDVIWDVFEHILAHQLYSKNPVK